MYAYSATKLWIAYGVAIFVGLILSVVGLAAILGSGSSYSNSFSAVFRVARGADMSKEVETQDTDGRDPLPAYLKDATVIVCGSGNFQDGANGRAKEAVVKPAVSAGDRAPHDENHGLASHESDGLLPLELQLPLPEADHTDLAARISSVSIESFSSSNRDSEPTYQNNDQGNSRGSQDARHPSTIDLEDGGGRGSPG